MSDELPCGSRSSPTPVGHPPCIARNKKATRQFCKTASQFEATGDFGQSNCRTLPNRLTLGSSLSFLVPQHRRLYLFAEVGQREFRDVGLLLSPNGGTSWILPRLSRDRTDVYGLNVLHEST